MPYGDAIPAPGPAGEQEDVEWELMCSAREMTVGLIPDPDALVMVIPANPPRTQPWERDRRRVEVRRRP